MMTMAMMLAGAALLIYVFVASINGHIPRRGRWIDVDGEEVVATITNSNRNADKYATLRAKDENGRKYAVKLRPTEAKFWIRGDKIKITLTKDGKNYRIHFHEYFKENEETLREKAMENLGKNVKFYSIAARMVGYKKESLEALRASKADSQTIFAFETYMRYIDRYFIYGIVASLLFVPFVITEKLQRFQLLLPLLILVTKFLSINATAKLCKKIYEKAIRK